MEGRAGAAHGRGVGDAAGRTGGAALVALGGTVVATWAIVGFAPDAAVRLGARWGLLAVPAASLVEAWVLLWIALLMTLVAIAIGAALRQRIAIGSLRHPPAPVALATGAAGFALALALSWAAGVVALSHRHSGAVDARALLGGAALVLWGAFGEEILFRGLLQPILARAWGYAAALLVQALVFAFGHWVGGWRDPVSLLNIFVAAFWFGLLARASGGIAAPVLAHAGWNGVESLVFGASPNPGPGSFGSVVDVDIVGPALLGGTADGMNASLTTTLVLVLLVGGRMRRGASDNAARFGGGKAGQ